MMSRWSIVKHKKLRRGLMALLAMVFALAAPSVAFAHPLGNFTINRYSRLELGTDQIRVRYVIDMAEIPTFQERQRMDLDGDGSISEAERDQYLVDEVAALKRNLHLVVNGEPIVLESQDGQLEFPPGQGGLLTTRLSVWFSAKLPSAATWQVEYHDDNFAGRVGWREVLLRANAVSVLQSSVPTTDVSNELRAYPQDMLQSPLAVNSASIQFAPISAGQAANLPELSASSALGTQSIDGRTNDRFAELIAIPDLGLGAILLSLLGAFVWGAAHAFSPGHGKTIVAAYLVGSRATPRHALFLGLTTTITHTAGVFALGAITLLASRYIVPDQLYPWLETTSGLLLIVLGLSLFIGRLRRTRAQVNDHDHVHSFDHDHEHRHDHGHDHVHHHPHHDEDDHPHTHSHMPPGADNTPVTWRSLLALGISGGLLPCPSALVVMLGAIALNRLVFGLVLIIVFSMGLAGTLTTIGIAMVHAKSLLERFNRNRRVLGRLTLDRNFIRVLPAISALFIMAAGVGITLAALAQAGMIRL